MQNKVHDLKGEVVVGDSAIAFGAFGIQPPFWQWYPRTQSILHIFESFFVFCSKSTLLLLLAAKNRREVRMETWIIFRILSYVLTRRIFFIIDVAALTLREHQRDIQK
jgi:hypothetical protein